MITTIIFDIESVLAAYDWEDALRRLGCQDETFEAVANAVFRSPDWKEMDRGVLTLEELLQRFIRRAPEYEKEIRQVIHALGSITARGAIVPDEVLQNIFSKFCVGK